MASAEKYHLKWDSHQSFLNLSVSTLFKNEKFADVMLFSCSPDSVGLGASYGLGIPAHKFILSSCSLFFAAILESTPITTTGIMNIVLPPELSRKAIQILVQYMYSGEATVSNDILKEVLRGGEILKIRGLCRPSSNSKTNGNQHLPINPPHQTEAHSSLLSTVPQLDQPPSTSYDFEHGNDYRGLGASVLPQESPVIVKSPKPAPHSAVLGPLTVNTGPSISVNREVAIDPGDKCYYGCPQYAKSLCTVADCRKCLPQDDAEAQPRTKSYDEELHSPIKSEPVDWPSGSERPASQISNPQIDKVKQEVTYSESEEGNGTDGDYDEVSTAELTCELCQSSFNDPKEWLSHIQNHADETDNEKSDSGSSRASRRRKRRPSDEESVASLKCDVCSTSFSTPAEWVRHIQTKHTENELAVVNSKHNPAPSKHSKVTRYKGANSCENPHSANRHPKLKAKRLQYIDYLDKACEICGEKFQTYATMIIHKRTTHANRH